jgi:hypothetical protein
VNSFIDCDMLVIVSTGFATAVVRRRSNRDSVFRLTS